jgi:two-component system response regulator DesR
VIRIMVAEDMRILRETLVAVLSLEADIEVVAEVPTGEAIVPAAVECRPDVAVLDIDLPGMDGLTAAGQLHQRLPDCRVLILTVLGRPAHLRKALAMHVSGFLVKDAPADDLIAAVRRVAAGERVFDAELTVAALEQEETRCRRGRSRCCGGARPASGLPRLPLSFFCPTAPSAITWPQR